MPRDASSCGGLTISGKLMSPAQSTSPRYSVANFADRMPWNDRTFFVKVLSPAIMSPAGLDPVYRSPRRLSSAATLDSSALFPPNDSAMLKMRSGGDDVSDATSG